MIKISEMFARKCGPIGLDIGSRSIKMVQFNQDRTAVVEAARLDLPADQAPGDETAQSAALAKAIGQAYESHQFRGHDAVVCLGAPQLFVQNIRVPKSNDAELKRHVQQEAAARVPYSMGETEIRFLDAADIRQGDTTKREVILLACHRPVLDRLLKAVTAAGLRPISVDIEPAALLRGYVNGHRRDADREQRVMYVHIGAANSFVVIAQGSETLFVKYVDIGGTQMDQSVARHLNMDLEAAALLRRHNGDRRADAQDPEVARGVAHAVRPVIDRLVNELSLCVRYHSVTFRGTPLARLVLGGGEASQRLVDSVAERLDLKCELGEPLRGVKTSESMGRGSQWDIAAGLALRHIESN